jgi:hypothetical protein
MTKGIILSLALTAVLAVTAVCLVPSTGWAGQDDRVERLRNRAEFRREMRDLARERVRDRAEVRRELMRLRSEFRWHARDASRGIHDWSGHDYRDSVRDAMREMRRALHEAFRDGR